MVRGSKALESGESTVSTNSLESSESTLAMVKVRPDRELTDLAVLLVLLIGIASAERSCLIRLPKTNKNGRLFFSVFQWTTPKDSFDGYRDCIRDGEVVTLTCDTGFVKNEFMFKSYLFECTDGKLNGTLSYEDLLCRSEYHRHTRVRRIPAVELRSTLFQCSGKGLELYEVDATKEDGSWKPLYKVCFDRNVMRPKYSFQPVRLEVQQKTNSSRRDVWGFDFFGDYTSDKVKLSSGYAAKYQQMRITKAFPERYGKKKMYPYKFDRGHLAPYADFVEMDDKKASCEYINVAPQWREFNSNSWSLVERTTRSIVARDPGSWEVCTGVYGSIPTQRGPLFLSPFFNENGRFLKGYLPVPKLYWKVAYNIYDRAKSRVFVGVNNPELTSPDQFTRGYQICQPLRLKGGTYFTGNEFMGFTYECDLDEFIARLAKEENVIRQRKTCRCCIRK